MTNSPPSPTRSQIRVLLVEDHTMVRQGLRALLAHTEALVVVGEARDGETGVRLAVELDAEVVVMDLSLPGIHGTEALRQIKAQAPSRKVVVLSMHASAEAVARARAAGCDGYVVKGGDVSELSQAIVGAAAGQPYFSSEVRQWVGGATAPQGLERLSNRERQILQLIARGGTNKTIAQELEISVHTVNAHRVSLMAKLDLHDAQGLTRFAVKHGLIDPTSE